MTPLEAMLILFLLAMTLVFGALGLLLIKMALKE
jgi:hypothetical protein